MVWPTASDTRCIQALKTLLFISSLIIWTGSYGQLDQLKGVWISDLNYAFKIDATELEMFGLSLLSNLKEDIRCKVYSNKDTLRFEHLYHRNINNEFVEEKDAYNFIILLFNDSTLILRPCSNLSISFFGTGSTLKFIRQEFAEDTSIHFNKILFHPVICCSDLTFIYHLEINSDKHAKLFAEYVSYMDSEGAIRRDTAKQGYFSGILSDTSYNKVVNAIRTCNLRTVTIDPAHWNGPWATIVIYFNGQIRCIEARLPLILDNLYEVLYEICESGELQKTDSKFDIER